MGATLAVALLVAITGAIIAVILSQTKIEPKASADHPIRPDSNASDQAGTKKPTGAKATDPKYTGSKIETTSKPDSPAKQKQNAKDRNSIGMKLILIPAGEFTMGSPDSEPNRYPEEKQHKVIITRPFHLSAHLVTQVQYQTVMGNNPSWFAASGGGKGTVAGLDTSGFPVDQVSWDDAIAFCQKLTGTPEEKKVCRDYRLPTEAEWEYACRAGSNTPYYCGQSISTDQANFDNVVERTTKVGSYPPNAFGLYDMHGNLLQWCSDWFEHTYYRNSPGADPQGPGNGKLRVDRGGSWNGDARACRAAVRSGHNPEHRLNYVGFRVVCTMRTP